MKNLNLNSVEIKTSGGSFPDLKPGGYICRIVMVTDVPEKEYLRVDMDIANGEFKGFYQQLAEKFGFWGCTQYWSYKDKNLGYFKGNIKAVEESNSNYTFSSDEHELEGKLVGAVFGEEEYMNRQGEIRCNVKPRFVCGAERILEGDYKVPKRRVYDAEKAKKPVGGGGGRADFLNPVMKDTDEDLDAWAKGQKLPWE